MAEATLVANDMTATNLHPDQEVTDGFRSGSNWPPCYQLSTGRWVCITADPAVEGSFRVLIRAMDRAGTWATIPASPPWPTAWPTRTSSTALVADWVAGFESAAELEAGRRGVDRAGGRRPHRRGDPGHRMGQPTGEPSSMWRSSPDRSRSPCPSRRGGSAVPRRRERHPVVGFRGQHNREVLGQVFGLADRELDDLEARSVISARLPRWMTDDT